MMRNLAFNLTMAALVVGLPVSGALAASESAAGNRPQSSVVADGPVTATTSVSRSSARVVEPIELTLEVDAPHGLRVEMPQIGERLGDFDVRHVERFKDLPVADAANSRRAVIKVTIDTLKTGDIELPTLAVQYGSVNEKGELKSLSTKPIKIHITSVLEGRADPTKFRDIKGTVDVPINPPQSYAWLIWGGGGFAAVSAAATILLFVRRRRGPTPAAWALTAIDELAAVEVCGADQAEALIDELVGVVREFFELEFGMPSAAYTSAEFLNAASQREELGSEVRKNLQSIAALADHVKFARYEAGSHAVAKAIEKARIVIKECVAAQQSSTKGVA